MKGWPACETVNEKITSELIVRFPIL